MQDYFSDQDDKQTRWTFWKKGLLLIIVGGLFGFVLAGQLGSDSMDSFSQSQPDFQTQELEKQSEDTTTSQARDLYVDIKGAVKVPGVYQLSHGSRLIDLIDQAGGFRQDAATQDLNLSLLLEDQMMIQVLSQSEWEEQEFERALMGQEMDNPVGLVSQVDQPVDGLINLNTADQSQLEELPGIGPAKAKQIIQYRQENGSFSSVYQLLEVSGIGSKTFEGLKDAVTVGS